MLQTAVYIVLVLSIRGKIKWSYRRKRITREQNTTEESVVNELTLKNFGSRDDGCQLHEKMEAQWRTTQTVVGHVDADG